MIKSLLIILLYKALIVLATRPTCNGEHEYKDDNEICQTCLPCGPGFQPSSHQCGYGFKASLYKCEPCPDGSFSDIEDYKLCKTCSPCVQWNSEVLWQCTKTRDAHCGECYHDFYRPLKSDGGTDKECHKCEGADHPSCQKPDWKTLIIIILVVVSSLAIIAVAVCLCWRYKRRNKSPSNSKGLKKEIRRKTVNIPLLPIITCNSETITSTASSAAPLTTSSTSIQEKIRPQTPPEFKCIVTSKPANSSTYSKMPTAEFGDPYGDMPTLQFHTSEQLNARNDAHNVRNNEHGVPRHVAPITNRLEDLFTIQVEAFDTNSTISTPNKQ
ncbi:uncharacterized protein LOC143453541 isoform X2 [Clavelina lepadiformis]